MTGKETTDNREILLEFGELLRSILQDDPEEAAQLMYAKASRKNFRKGEYLFQGGDIENYLYYIVDGGAKSYLETVNGKEIIVNFSFESEFVCCYQSFLERKPNEMNIVCLKHTETMRWSYKSIQDLYQNYSLIEKIGRKIAERLYIDFIDDWADLMTKSVLYRFKKLMQRQPKLFQQVPSYMIAAYLGIEPESLSRIKRKAMKD